MPLPFQIHALPAEPFAPLFGLPDTMLQARGITRHVADADPGYPCRVSLRDAVVGETVLLLPFTHHNTASPYRASGPIYVRQQAVQAHPAPCEVPPVLRRRLLSVRAYSQDGSMVGAEAGEGSDLEAMIDALFANPAARFLHLHNARPGCWQCRVERATP